MKTIMQLSMLLVFILTVGGCAKHQVRDFAGSAIASGADTEVRYTPSQCRTLKMQCVQGEFQEWETSEKDMGCSCKKL